MPQTIILGGNGIVLDPKKIIGSGGEADIYKINSDVAVKIFKTPNHPDYSGQPAEQQGAKERIETHQRKLKDFPKNLPPMIVIPIDLAYDEKTQRVVGYSMNLVKTSEVLMKYADRNFRSTIPNDIVGSIFRGLHSTVDLTHKAGIVVGDFNDLNVLVSGINAFIIDADSCQWGPYICKVFTAKFVDPLICNSNGTFLSMVKEHNFNSDWYAFSVMLMQSLLFVDPYGGVYKPKDPNRRMVNSARPLHRITIFNNEVIYPKPAIPYGVLSDDLLQWFHQIFEKDFRDIFPQKILDNLRWTKCSNCGTEHARGICPNCATPGIVKEVIKVRGKVLATRIFKSPGQILFAAYQNDKINYLYQDGECMKREDGSIVAKLVSDPLMRFRICGASTIIARGNQMVTIIPNERQVQTTVDTFGTLPMIDANEKYRYWLQGGQLWRNDEFGPERIGDVLENQTLFWVGQNFGFGFYKASSLCVYFLFDVQKTGINDTVKLPRLTGQLVDSTCAFSNDRCWFFISTQQSGKTINQCFVIKRDGSILGSAKAESGERTWLGTIRGKMAVNNLLLAATDDGVVRVETNDQGQIEEKQQFPDTEPFVDSSCYLYPGIGCLNVIKPKEVETLKIG